MTLKKRIASSRTLLTGLYLSVLLILGIDSSYSPFEMSAAAANTGYGIQGQMAPEFNLTHWIDGRGQKTEPISLADFRGKVVFNDFHVDVGPAVALIEKLLQQKRSRLNPFQHPQNKVALLLK